MKKLVLLFCLLSLSGVGCAASLFAEDNTARQEYRSVNSPNTVMTPQPLTVQSTDPAQNKNEVFNTPTTDVNQNEVLTTQLTNLSTQVNNLSKKVDTLTQTVAELQSDEMVRTEESNLPFLTRFNLWMKAEGPAAYVNLLGAAIILLLIGFVVGLLSRKNRRQVMAPETTYIEEEIDMPDTDAEYNFMATDEAIPAQLDLARSYLAMDDTEEAKKSVVECDQARQRRSKSGSAKFIERHCFSP